MTANGERRDGRPYEDGTGYGPDGYPVDPAGGQYGTYDQGQGTGYSQGYAPQDPAYGYDQQGQYGNQGQPGGYGNSGYETPTYPAPSYENPTYDTPSYGGGAAPGYGTQSSSYESSGYESGSYQSPSYGGPAYGDSGYDSGAYPAQGYSGAPAPGTPYPASPGTGGQGGYGSGAYPAAPGPGGSVPGPSPDYDTGAYAAYDSGNYPQADAPGRSAGPASGVAGAAAARGAQAEPAVRRTGSTSPTASASTTGSFRVQVPQPAAPAGAPRTPPSRPAGPPPGAASPGSASAAAAPPGTPAPPRPRPGGGPAGAPGRPKGGRTAANRERVGYAADEFDFVDDESEESEDVIDWLKFAETRSERRDERRRQLRTRGIALLAVLALAGVAVGGYFAYDKWWGGSSASAARTTGGAVLIQLRGAQGEATASAVLADDPSRGTATMITVPSNTVVNTAGAGPMALGELMVTDGAGASREALAQLIGVQLSGSWVVSEPVLQGLVDMVGGVELNADVEVKGPDGKVLVPAGPSKANGIAARAYATYRVPGEKSALGAERFGRVITAVLGVLPSDAKLVADLLRNLANVSDPSLPDARLAELLTSMAKAIQAKQFKSADLPLQADGVIDVAAAAPVVKDLLGGSVQVAKAEGPARVMVGDASGKPNAQEAARIKVVNAGYSYVPGGAVEPKAKPVSVVQYTEDDRRDAAVQVALTLGLPEAAAKKAEGQMLADIVVTLGQDFTP
ncbi:LCP family protein [Yinghuangia soli]|uniref:LytR C-terminal domain-containing protein n=1 Tax=Yinghuangia soli TaxID=2908204 RepID=A0AA41U662_9ACTN|nr:LCP family protein [Yinghuangia soli]MCF2530669.1 LytR C-terminal domain-containing protein [Yinghuangia soli]